VLAESVVGGAGGGSLPCGGDYDDQADQEDVQLADRLPPLQEAGYKLG